MYKIELSDILDKKLIKLAKKNKFQLGVIDRKIKEIQLDPTRYKNLVGGELKGFKRVHIDKHFVLIFEVDIERKIVRFLNYDHHNKVY